MEGCGQEQLSSSLLVQRGLPELVS